MSTMTASPASDFHAALFDLPSPPITNTSGSAPTSGRLSKSPRETSFTREGILGSAHKARNMSRSSASGERQNGNQSNSKESGDDSTTNGNPLKRRNTNAEGTEYPRRRATIACEICRSRKSRCDGAKPKCRLCIELGAECIYREPGIKLDAGDKLILERLNRIEGLLQSNILNQNQAVHSLAAAIGSGASPGALSHRSAATAMSREEEIMQSHVNFVSMIPVTGLGTWTSASTNISTMPKEHTNAALHLLQWPIIRDLVSRPYDPQILLQLEMSREPLNLPKNTILDLSNTTAYIRAFFSRVNVWYACVNPFNWATYYRTALSTGFRDGPESCIVLLVLALGHASVHGSISRVPRGEDPPGLNYFAAAWNLLPSLMTRNTVIASQCMILAAAYLFYLVRPLEAWTLLSSTSSKLQLLLSGPGRVPEEQRELSERVYWNALLFESDLLAELDLPHSGIVHFEETVGLPGGFSEFDQASFEQIWQDEPQDENNAVGRDEVWYFLAEIALRRLLNRVSQLIYSKDSVATMSSLEPIVAELDFQLGQWYENLPVSLQFPYTRELLSCPVQTVLRLRFYACRTIIFRPYILAVMDNEGAALDPAVRENCRKCLDAAVRQLENITAHHAGHMPYLWQGALSIVSQTLLVMGATMSPALATLLPPPHEMDTIINGVVEEIARYSRLAPSLALSAEIIREAEMRRQDILAGMGMR